MKKEIFEPYLDANEKNQIQIDVDSLSDDPKLNFWYIKYAKSDFVDYIDEECLEMTISKKVKQGKDIKSFNKYIVTLDSTSEEDRLDIVKYLKEQDTDIKISDEDGVTPLHRSAQYGRLDIVKYLVKQGVDIKVSDKNGSTPIQCAGQQKQWDVVKYLVEQGADIKRSDKYGNTILHTAV